MMTLELFLILLLQFEAGIRGQELRLYHRVGDDVVLPCNSPSSSYSCDSCDFVTWLYNKQSETKTEVEKGTVSQNSARAARLRFDSKCSLLINNITAEDYGRYICRVDPSGTLDGFVNLDILNISPPDAAPTKDGDVTLKCSLLRYPDHCPEKSVRWVDESGAELPAEDDGSKSNCVSSLTVKHQRGSNTRVTCQFVERNKVEIEVHYPSVTEGMTAGSTARSPLSFIMMTLRIVVLILMIGLTVGLIRGCCC